jgi:hypothetical protein
MPNDVSSLPIEEKPETMELCELEEGMSHLTIKAKKEGLPPDLSNQMAKLTINHDHS